MSKPLARFADDEDLEKMLKALPREGDPMLLFTKRKKGNAGTTVMKKKGLFCGRERGLHADARLDMASVRGELHLCLHRNNP